MNDFEARLKGIDMRSIGQSNVVTLINSQIQFDELFQLLYNSDSRTVMRAADAIEKITVSNQQYLKPHKKGLLDVLYKAEEKELKWHLALLMAGLQFSEQKNGNVWQILTKWAMDKKESKIVRVNSLQGLSELLEQKKELKQDFFLTVSQVQDEHIPRSMQESGNLN